MQYTHKYKSPVGELTLLVTGNALVGRLDKLTGYAGGIHNKEILLKTEQGIIPAK